MVYNKDEFKKIIQLETGHVNFLGKYVFEDEKIVSEDGLRPLKK